MSTPRSANATNLAGMSEVKSGFGRDFLLRIGRSNPWLPALVFVPYIALTTGYAVQSGNLSAGTRAALVLGGILGWTLLEYLLHRFSFHSKGHEGRSKLNPVHLLNALSSGVHGLHHDKPNFPDLVVAPVLLSLPSALAYLGLITLLSGSFEAAAFFMAGLTASYLVYEFVHYSTHQRRPRTWIGKFLTKHHMHHHFTDPNNYFGVTSPLWDLVFGTRPKRLEVK
ncbi:MAG: sterol desaturase family protein [Bdellovibrionales bacterium]|nr:sterol desaturase family protein [Bdellovibrionales bacterium]